MSLTDLDLLARHVEEPVDLFRIVKGATRNLNLHGWTIRPTPDMQGLTVSHGEYTVSIMFGKQLANYIEHGTTTWP